MNKKHFLVVGAGFSGAVLSREISGALNCKITVIDERDHIAGNCHTERDAKTGIMVHRYGPHIFNTNREDVWNYVQSYGEFKPCINRVKAVNDHGVFSMPINLHTINQFFKKTFSPAEAEEFLKTLGDQSITEPQNFEEQALKMLGADLYYAFFYGYTKKQWGCEPRELPASILKRLPIRFNYDDNYYNTRFQGIPTNGYTEIISNILTSDNIEVKCGQAFNLSMMANFDHVFYTGPIDRFFEYSDGRLGYRTVFFEEDRAHGDHQGNAVINYPEMNVPYTRVHEHKHFAPWEQHDETIFFKEYSKETEEQDTPYYPKRLAADMELLDIYKDKAKLLNNVSFIGRLGTYRYLNMDQAIGETLDFAQDVIKAVQVNSKLPILPDIAL